MSRHSGFVRLRHMLDSAREAVALVEGKTRHDLENTRLLELGLTSVWWRSSAKPRQGSQATFGTDCPASPGRMW